MTKLKEILAAFVVLTLDILLVPTAKKELEKTVKAKAKELVKQHHPDNAQNGDKKKANDITARINAARDLILSNLDATADYLKKHQEASANAEKQAAKAAKEKAEAEAAEQARQEAAKKEWDTRKGTREAVHSLFSSQQKEANVTLRLVQAIVAEVPADTLRDYVTDETKGSTANARKGALLDDMLSFASEDFSKLQAKARQEGTPEGEKQAIKQQINAVKQTLRRALFGAAQIKLNWHNSAVQFMVNQGYVMVATTNEKQETEMQQFTLRSLDALARKTFRPSTNTANNRTGAGQGSAETEINRATVKTAFEILDKAMSGLTLAEFVAKYGNKDRTQEHVLNVLRMFDKVEDVTKRYETAHKEEEDEAAPQRKRA